MQSIVNMVFNSLCFLSFSVLVSWGRFSSDNFFVFKQRDVGCSLISTFVYSHKCCHWDLTFSHGFHGSITQVSEISISLQYSDIPTKSWLLLGDCSRPLRSWGPVSNLMLLQDWSAYMFTVTQFIDICQTNMAEDATHRSHWMLTWAIHTMIQPYYHELEYTEYISLTLLLIKLCICIPEEQTWDQDLHSCLCVPM